MRLAYFDCFAGISGDMILGAFLDLGLELKELESELALLSLTGYRLLCQKVVRQGVSGTRFQVDQIAAGEEERDFAAIRQLISDSKLNEEIKERSIDIFSRLARAEGKVHGVTPEKVSFHEVGAIDSIIDVVGTVIAFHKLGIEVVYVSPLPLGGGTVHCEHGRLPVPAPGTVELLKGIPVCRGPVAAELVTPTGAAIITEFATEFGNMPQFNLAGVGYGAGEREFAGFPNLLRVMVGELKAAYREDRITVIETNIDDATPQLYDYLIELLLEKGALDVFLTPVQMKKNRPAVLLTVLARKEDEDILGAIVFRETPSLGLRIYEVDRRKLDREQLSVNTQWGMVQVKVARLRDRITTVAPEYEDCKKVARKHGIPWREVYDEVRELGKKHLLAG